MTIYDKALWHIDAGENKTLVLDRFKRIFSFLQKHNLLSEEGMELYEFGIDESISLHERLLTDAGNQLIRQHYDTLLSLEPVEIEKALNGYFNAMQ